MNLHRVHSGFAIPAAGLLVAGLLLSGPLLAAEPTDDLASSTRALSDFIDGEVEAVLTAEGVTPAEQTSDENLVRRLTLDLAGRIPTVLEVTEYRDSTNPRRREFIVDRLLGSPEFAKYMARRFDWFITAGDGRIEKYLEIAFQNKLGWDQIFRDIVLADLHENEDALPYLQQRVRDTERLTNEVSVTFFGVNISCAKCHDHPLVPNWTQDHFYGMKSFFDRVFDNGGFVAERDFGTVKFTTTSGDERQANLMFLSGRDVTPDDMSGPDDTEQKRLRDLYRELKKKKEPPPPPKSSLRQRLVDVALAEGENQFFAKSIVNRIWYQLIGHGLVMPLDQMHDENPPSHPVLLDRLAQDLIEHGYDLQRTIQAVVLSDIYSRSSIWTNGERPEPKLFAVANVRPLTPTQLASSLSLATTDQTFFDDVCREELYEQIAVKATPVDADKFDQPSDSFRVAADEALFFSNAPELEQKYLHSDLVRQLSNMTDQKRIEVAVWSTLSRPAEEEELRLLRAYLAGREDRPRQAIQQLVWALLTSSEFRFNH